MAGLSAGSTIVATPRTWSLRLSEKPYTLYTAEGPEPRRRRLRLALLILGLLVALAGIAAGGVYAWTSIVLSKSHRNVDPQVYEALSASSARGIGVTPAAPANPGRAMNILVLGSDKRADGQEENGRSDTIMIVHLDPDADFASILSLPRDLRVEIAGHGLQKINAAYAFGGDALAIETVRAVTGLYFDFYINVDFEAFRRITTSLGGVYVDVDRRYYADDPNYEHIDVQPGYQRLAGDQALQYVRFRHDLNSDYGRIDRQQRFLRSAKEQAMGWNALVRLPQVADLLAENATTTMSTGDVFKLAYWGVKLRSARVRQVTLQGARDETIGGVDYVIANEETIRAAVENLLAPPEASAGRVAGSGGAATTTLAPTSTPTTTAVGAAPAPELDLAGISVEVLNANGRNGEAKATARYLEGLGARLRAVGDAPGGRIARSAIVYPADQTAEAARVSEAVGVFKLVEDNTWRHVALVLGADFVLPGSAPAPVTDPPVPNARVWQYLAGAAGFPVMAPGVLPPGATYAGFRIYPLQTDKGAEKALKVMYRLGRQDQYLGLMETTFVDAPAASDGETVTAGGLALTVVSVGDKVDHIWWRRGDVLYWLSNTLSYQYDREEMLAVARSMMPIGGTK